jgi:DNA-directed RNA polymerase specialized sigma24 family protein
LAEESVDWASLFFDERAAWPDRLMSRAQRRFGDSPDAEAAYNHAFDELSRDDWARLRDRYRGTGSAEGFMTITFLNLLEEYAVRKYGRRRAPVWVQRLGPPWTQIYELLCLRRQAPESIVDLLGARDGHEPAEVRTAIREVRGRIPNCGQYVGESPMPEEPVEPAETAAGASPVAHLEHTELGHLLAVLQTMFTGERNEGDEALVASDDLADARKRIARLQDGLQLPDQHRLLLKLVYQQNCSIPEAARALQMNERTARRVHTRLISALRQSLAQHGFAP